MNIKDEKLLEKAEKMSRGEFLDMAFNEIIKK
jgi:hypothetical protein